MKSSEMPLRIEIKALVVQEKLVIVVRNSGKWVDPDDPARSKPSGTGTGLKNVKQRLDNRFPGRYSLKTKESDGSVVVTLKIQRNVEKENDQEL